MVTVSSCFPPALAWAVSDAREEGRRSQARMSEPAGQDPSERDAVDADLLRRIAAGDRQALAGLYDRHSRPLYATALRILGDAAEAQDVVHDSFVVLWEKAGQFSVERGTVFCWAVTLVRNRAIDRLRMRRRRSELLERSVPADLGYGEAGGGADERATLGERASAVRAAVAGLPEEQKKALELAFFGGLTQQEIAERLQEPLGTVKARIRRGLMKLRDSLAHRL